MKGIPQFNPKDFEKVNKLGSGTFGNVFLVKNIKTQKRYAVKTPKKSIDKNDFENEKQTYQKTNNAAVLSLLGYSTKNFKLEDQILLFTDYMPNGSLDKMIKKFKKNDGTIKYIILLGIALGMKYLHSQGIIHRDLKACNILLDESMHPKICDFGESKISDKEFTDILMTKITGTPLYMAPEILKGEYAYNYKVDVYSFSFLAYELITGKDAFYNRKFRSKYQAFKAIKDGERPDLSIINDDYIKKFLSKCWNEKPADRPSFLEIVDEIMHDPFRKFFNATEKKKIDEYLNLFDDDLKSPNSKDALDWKKKANEGDIDSILMYAQMLYNGSGAIMNKKEAAKYWKKAADLGNGIGAYQYAYYLRHETGIKRDINESIRYYKKAAEKGLTIAMNNLGHLYANGKEIQANYKEAFKYYSMAAKYGDSNGYINMGNMIGHGKGTPKNEKLALQCFKKAADLGNDRAMYIYALHLKKYSNEKDEYIKYLQKAADKGNYEAMNYLSSIKIIENGINLNDQETINFLKNITECGNTQFKQIFSMLGIDNNDSDDIMKKAGELKVKADNGDKRSMFLYAKMLYSGEGVDIDKEEASKYFRKAAYLGDFHAMFELGKMLVNGDGIPEKKKEGCKYLNKSITNRNVDLMYSYGQLLRKGEGVPMDKIEALSLIKLSAEKHYNPAMFSYGQMLIKGEGTKVNKKEGIKYIEQSCIYDAEYMYQYAEMHRKGYGIPVNKKSAAEWFEKAANFNDFRSIFSLGIMHYFGDGIPINKKEGIRLIKYAADRENNDAIKMYAGLLISENNLKEASKYIKIAAEKKDQISFFLYKYVFKFHYYHEEEEEEEINSISSDNNNNIINVNIYNSFIYETNNFINLQNLSIPQKIRDEISEEISKYKKFIGINYNLIQQNDPNTLCTIYHFTDCCYQPMNVFTKVMQKNGIQVIQTCWNQDIYFNEKMVPSNVLNLLFDHLNNYKKNFDILGINRNIFDGRQIATYIRVNPIKQNVTKQINQSIENLLIPKGLVFNKIKYPLENDIIINEDMILKDKKDFDLILNEIRKIGIEPINIERNRLYLYGDYLIRKLFQTFSFICFNNEIEKMKALNLINSIVYSGMEGILNYKLDLHYAKIDDSCYTKNVRNNLVKIFQSLEGFGDIQEHVLSIENPVRRTYVGFDSIQRLKVIFTKFIHYSQILLNSQNAKIFLKKKNLIYIVVKGNIDAKIEKEIKFFASDVQENCTEYEESYFYDMGSKLISVSFYGFDTIVNYVIAVNLLKQSQNSSNISFFKYIESKTFLDEISSVPEEYLFHESL